MHNAEQHLREARQWEQEHVPDDVLGDWAGRSKDLLTDWMKLREIRKDIKAEESEEGAPTKIKALLPALYSAAYCFHLRTGPTLLPQKVSHQLAQVHAYTEVMKTLASFEEKALGEWG